MSALNVIRDHLYQVGPFFYQFEESNIHNNISFWCDFLRSFSSFFETIVLSGLFYIFSFHWIKDFIHFPILTPETQLARFNLGAFSAIPLFPSDLFPKSVNFPILISVDSAITSFQSGFSNALFLTFPRSLSFLVTIRRYWLQGFGIGLRRTAGYRRGETLLLVRVVNGFAPLWWTTNSFSSLSIGLLITRFILWESFSYHEPYYYGFFSTTRREKISDALERNLENVKTIIVDSFRSRYPFFIVFVHFFYSWTELGTFFGTFVNQTCTIREFPGDPLHFSYISEIGYRIGLFLGGLFFDFCFRIVTLIRFERLFLKLHYPPTEWKRIIHKLTSYFMISFSFRRIPYYSADYLLFSSIGFFGRDSELSQRVSKRAFSYPIRPGRPLSILFEGRNVIGEDCYGRPSPDIIHKPLVISRLAIEAKRDLVDETYRTQQTNQRVDSVYLGNIERKIFEWLSIRNPKSPILNQIADDQNKTAAILVNDPIRKGIGANVTPRSNPQIRKLPRVDFERSSDRFIRWFRTVRYTKSGEDKRFFGLPLGYARKPPESLFALFTSDFSQQSYLASIGMLEPQRVVRYSSSTEFTRKQNARRSPLYRGPIFRYINLLLGTRSKVRGFSSDISTRQQQCDLYHARRVLHNYVASSRRYLDIERSLSTFSNEIAHRISWQNKYHSYLFGGNRSRSNSVYSQQYVGNLQLIRRLFSVSWDSNQNALPPRLQLKGKQLLRRKISLDQSTFDSQKTIFEHEELGKTLPLLTRDQDKRQIPPDLVDVPIERTTRIDSWIKRRSFPDSRVETAPLYIGWDNRRHVVTLCNRFFPLELAIRTKLSSRIVSYPKSILEDFESYYYNGTRKESSSWPKNFRVRRMRLRGARYNIRAFSQRRVPIGNISPLMSSDRRTWSQKPSSIFAFWFNPRSDLQRENIGRSYNPVRGSQRFPLSLERGAFPETYVPGNLQPITRGGFTWPGIGFLSFTQKDYYYTESLWSPSF
jgi:hypothetical protein